MKKETEEKDKDLVAYNKVKALTDLELCQKIAVLEKLKTKIDSGLVWVVDGEVEYCFNPLTDGNQLIALMQKYQIARTWEAYDFIGWSYHVIGGDNPINITERGSLTNPTVEDISLNKAVCQAILLQYIDN